MHAFLGQFHGLASEVPFLEKQGDVNQCSSARGTSTSGPMTVGESRSRPMPKTAMATAIASLSNFACPLLNDKVVVLE
jgi:hypothetical protein